MVDNILYTLAVKLLDWQLFLLPIKPFRFLLAIQHIRNLSSFQSIHFRRKNYQSIQILFNVSNIFHQETNHLFAYIPSTSTSAVRAVWQICDTYIQQNNFGQAKLINYWLSNRGYSFISCNIAGAFLIKLMSINKSQEFLYFQNKARHYQNIRSARPCVNDKLDKQYRHTIDHSPNKQKKRLEPYLKMYDVQLQNDHLINRLVNISKSRRTEVLAQGNYSRYNNVQRQFRRKNPFKDETRRKIQIQNQEMVNRLSETKPAVGSNSQWHSSYQRQLSHRKNVSRYNDNQNSKGSLHISTSRFLPQHYKSYIFKVEGSEIEKKGETMAVISKQKLTKFPKILYTNRSNSVLQSDKSQKDLLNI